MSAFSRTRLREIPASEPSSCLWAHYDESRRKPLRGGRVELRGLRRTAAPLHRGREDDLRGVASPFDRFDRLPSPLQPRSGQAGEQAGQAAAATVRTGGGAPRRPEWSPIPLRGWGGDRHPCGCLHGVEGGRGFRLRCLRQTTARRVPSSRRHVTCLGARVIGQPAAPGCHVPDRLHPRHEIAGVETIPGPWVPGFPVVTSQRCAMWRQGCAFRSDLDHCGLVRLYALSML